MCDKLWLKILAANVLVIAGVSVIAYVIIRIIVAIIF